MFDRFVQKWLGRVVDYDHVFQYQCVDLIKQYWFEVYGIASGAWGNAIDYWTHPNSTMLKYFSKVKNTEPKKGDVVVLRGLSGNPYGHIVIAMGDVNEVAFLALEQNGATGSGGGRGGDVIRTRWIQKNRIAGVLRRKSVHPAKPSPPQIVITGNGWGLYNIAKAAGFKDYMLPSRWISITKKNTGNTNWIKFNRSLKPGQRVKVR